MARRTRYIDDRLAAESPLIRKVQVGKTTAAFPTLEAFEREHLADYKPHDAQLKLRTAMLVARFVTVVAGRRSGKTFGGGREFLRRVVRDYHARRAMGRRWKAPGKIRQETKPFVWYWCVAPTYALGVYQRREIFEIIGGIDSPLILKWDAQQAQLWLVGGILIEFKTAENPLRLVGSGLDGIWIDEAARVKASAYDDNLRAALSDRPGWLLVTTTPLGKNWVYEKLWSQTLEGFERVHFRTVDNTALPHLVAEVEAARLELAKAVFLRNYEASFDAFEGKIFEDFVDDESHVVRGAVGMLTRRFGGVDWGFSNPGSHLSIGQRVDGSLLVFAERYDRGVTISPPPGMPNGDCWINRIRSAKVSHSWADPSEPEHILACRVAGVDVRRGNNEVLAGIDLLSTLLKLAQRPGQPQARPALFIHESCRNLRNELGSYRWGENGKPVKENDHAVDALRYGVYTESRRNRLFEVEKIAEKFPSAFDRAA